MQSDELSGLTTAQRLVLFSMTVLRDAGFSTVTKAQVIRGSRCAEKTVRDALCILRRNGWVDAHRSTDCWTGGENPTLYSLTAQAPRLLDSLLPLPV